MCLSFKSQLFDSIDLEVDLALQGLLPIRVGLAHHGARKKNCCDICVENTAYFIICKDVKQPVKPHAHPAEFTVCSHTAGCRPGTVS